MRLLSTFFLTSVIAVSVLVVLECIRPEVLLVGNVTVDIIDGNRTVGGAVAHAAAVIEAQGHRACVVSTAGKDAELSIFENHSLHIIPDKETLTFAHSYTWWGHRRVLHVTAKPAIRLDLEHVPFICRLAKTVLIMPLLPSDVNAPAFLNWRNLQNKLLPQSIGLAAQGMQRDLGTEGQVFSYKAPHPILLDSLGKGVSLFLSDVESDPWSEADFDRVLAKCDRVLITQGEKGADEYVGKRSKQHIDAAKVDKVVDTNGAGDTFATTYMLALAAGSDNPGRDASRAAAQIVTKPQSCKPWCSATDPFLANVIQVKDSQVQKTWISFIANNIDAKWGLFFAPTMLNKATDHHDGCAV